MKVMTIRNVPDPLYEAIARVARREGRSIQRQVLTLLDRVREVDRDPPDVEAAAIRRKLARRKLGDTVREVRAERRR